MGPIVVDEGTGAIERHQVAAVADERVVGVAFKIDIAAAVDRRVDDGAAEIDGEDIAGQHLEATQDLARADGVVFRQDRRTATAGAEHDVGRGAVGIARQAEDVVVGIVAGQLEVRVAAILLDEQGVRSIEVHRPTAVVARLNEVDDPAWFQFCRIGRSTLDLEHAATADDGVAGVAGFEALDAPVVDGCAVRRSKIDDLGAAAANGRARGCGVGVDVDIAAIADDRVAGRSAGAELDRPVEDGGTQRHAMLQHVGLRSGDRQPGDAAGERGDQIRARQHGHARRDDRAALVHGSGHRGG